jgi:hypothetical protein
MGSDTSQSIHLFNYVNKLLKMERALFFTLKKKKKKKKPFCFKNLFVLGMFLNYSHVFQKI